MIRLVYLNNAKFPINFNIFWVLFLCFFNMRFRINIVWKEFGYFFISSIIILFENFLYKNFHANDWTPNANTHMQPAHIQWLTGHFRRIKTTLLARLAWNVWKQKGTWATLCEKFQQFWDQHCLLVECPAIYQSMLSGEETIPYLLLFKLFCYLLLKWKSSWYLSSPPAFSHYLGISQHLEKASIYF